MPFSGADDPKLPSNVKKASAKKRRQWVSIWNSTFNDCEGDKEECESKAFRIANGVLKKRGSKEMEVSCKCGDTVETSLGEKEVSCEHCQRELKLDWPTGEKFFDEMPVPSVVEISRPFGGAMSFDDLDSWREGIDLNNTIHDTKFAFDAIYDNIWDNPEMGADQKLAATEQAANQMVSRMQNPESEKGLKERIKGFFLRKEHPTDEPKVEEHMDKDGSFFATKDINGDWRWLAIFTNKFQDNEKEIFSEKAHKDYENWVDSTGKYPTLRLWHVPGTDFGKADLVTYSDGFQLASGTFYKEYYDVAERLSKMPLGVSHGFAYRYKDLDGVYHYYRTFEISVLPQERAANSWSAFTFDSLKEETKMIDDRKREFLTKTFGPERVKVLEETLPKLNKELQEAGVGWKDLAEAIEGPPDSGDSNGGDSSDNSGGDSADSTTTDNEVKTEKKPDETSAKPDEKQEAEPAGVKELATSLREVLEPIATAVKELQTEVKELRRSDDEKISERLGPRAKDNVTNGGRPSESNDNVIDPEAAKGLDRAEKDKGEDPPAVAAARSIVDELMLGKRGG